MSSTAYQSGKSGSGRGKNSVYTHAHTHTSYTHAHTHTSYTLQTDPIMMLLMGGGGLDFDKDTAYRDVFLQDTCDNGCRKIAKLLGLEVGTVNSLNNRHFGS